MAEFYTKITDTFKPLRVSNADVPRRPPIPLEEVKKLMKNAKKPMSVVEGDMLPRLMKECYEDASVPAHIIFNSVFASGQWPARWKQETTVVIPKTQYPADLGECRNISCTPFLSKVLESVILADLQREIPVDEIQYGGIKASSVDHLLTDLYEAILNPLDAGNPTLVMSVD